MLAACRSMRRGVVASSALFAALGSSERPSARGPSLSPGRERGRVTPRPRERGRNDSEPSDSESVSWSSSASSLPVMPPWGERTRFGDSEPEDSDAVAGHIGVIIGNVDVLCRGEWRTCPCPCASGLVPNDVLLLLPDELVLVMTPSWAFRAGGVRRPLLRRRVRLLPANWLWSVWRRTLSVQFSTACRGAWPWPCWLREGRLGCESECLCLFMRPGTNVVSESPSVSSASDAAVTVEDEEDEPVDAADDTEAGARRRTWGGS